MEGGHGRNGMKYRTELTAWDRRNGWSVQVSEDAMEELDAMIQSIATEARREGFRAGQLAGPNTSPEPTPSIETA